MLRNDVESMEQRVSSCQQQGFDTILSNWPRPLVSVETRGVLSGFCKWDPTHFRFGGISGFFHGSRAAMFILKMEIYGFFAANRATPLLTQEQRDYVASLDLPHPHGNSVMAWFVARNAIEASGDAMLISALTKMGDRPWVSRSGYEVGPWPDGVRMGYDLWASPSPPYWSNWSFFARHDADEKAVAFLKSVTEAMARWVMSHEEAIKDIVRSELIRRGLPPEKDGAFDPPI